MKKFKFSRYSLLILSVLPVFFLESLTGFFDLNRMAIRTSKKILGNDTQELQSISSKKIAKNNLTCHMKWLSFNPVINKTSLDKKDKLVNELLECSLLHVNFLRFNFPSDMELAQKALLIYPEAPGIIFWLADGIEKDDPELAENLYRIIVDSNPSDSVSWHRLANLVARKGNIDEAIIYNINSCLNNDIGSNGCSGAARLLEQQGRYEEAIYYYRRSRHDFIRANADRLEELLAGSD